MRGDKKHWRVWWAAAALFAIYFPVAIWLKYSYVPPKMPPGGVLNLLNFQKYDGFAFYSLATKIRSNSDSNDDPRRSPMVVYEDGAPLSGPAHSSHGDIAKIGLGRFSHWNKLVFFSTSDNSDPRINGRVYWVVQPPEVAD